MDELDQLLQDLSATTAAAKPAGAATPMVRPRAQRACSRLATVVSKTLGCLQPPYSRRQDLPPDTPMVNVRAGLNDLDRLVNQLGSTSVDAPAAEAPAAASTNAPGTPQR